MHGFEFGARAGQIAFVAPASRNQGLRHTKAVALTVQICLRHGQALLGAPQFEVIAGDLRRHHDARLGQVRRLPFAARRRALRRVLQPAKQVQLPGGVKARPVALGQIALAGRAGIGLRQAAFVATVQCYGGQAVQFLFIQHRAGFRQAGLGDADVVVAAQRQIHQPVQLGVLQLLPPVSL
ncbi:hypothetical protein D3C72_1623280 [compost metagenome]